MNQKMLFHLRPSPVSIGDTYAMLYAGKKGEEWQTGLCALQDLVYCENIGC
jgi:hypothetical protein